VDISLARTRLDVFATCVLLVYAAVLTGLVLAAVELLEGTARLAALVGLVLFWLFHAGVYLVTWMRMRRVEEPLGLHGDGLHARSRFGEVVVPWAAVGSVRVERTWSGRRLRIRLVPAGDARRDGIVATVPVQVVDMVNRRGMRYSLRALDIGLDELRGAFVVQSGGRVHVT
jgi:hypothetical protein